MPVLRRLVVVLSQFSTSIQIKTALTSSNKETIMASDLKIDYIEMPASDFDAVQTFYEAVFSWTFEDYGAEYRAFSDGKLDGGFYRSSQRSSADEGAPLVIFYADDLEAVEKAVIAAGGNIVKPIFSFPGGRRFQFTDPHGNELAVWTHS